ncbi:MAG: SDR family NAD(P)-dependent oxidoreductase, partial [Terriglobia bacterium]
MAILDRFKLDEKTALVTGCRRGIGKAIAVGLAEAGADIIGVSRSMETSGSDIEKEVLARGRKFKAYACDFADRTALYLLIEQLAKDFPVIDVLVNNAGTI